MLGAFHDHEIILLLRFYKHFILSSLCIFCVKKLLFSFFYFYWTRNSVFELQGHHLFFRADEPAPMFFGPYFFWFLFFRLLFLEEHRFVPRTQQVWRFLSKMPQFAGYVFCDRAKKLLVKKKNNFPEYFSIFCYTHAREFLFFAQTHTRTSIVYTRQGAEAKKLFIHRTFFSIKIFVILLYCYTIIQYEWLLTFALSGFCNGNNNNTPTLAGRKIPVANSLPALARLSTTGEVVGGETGTVTVSAIRENAWLCVCVLLPPSNLMQGFLFFEIGIYC